MKMTPSPFFILCYLHFLRKKAKILTLKISATKRHLVVLSTLTGIFLSFEMNRLRLSFWLKDLFKDRLFRLTRRRPFLFFSSSSSQLCAFSLSFRCHSLLSFCDWLTLKIVTEKMCQRKDMTNHWLGAKSQQNWRRRWLNNHFIHIR